MAKATEGTSNIRRAFRRFVYDASSTPSGAARWLRGLLVAIGTVLISIYWLFFADEPLAALVACAVAFRTMIYVLPLDYKATTQDGARAHHPAVSGVRITLGLAFVIATAFWAFSAASTEEAVAAGWLCWVSIALLAADVVEVALIRKRA